MNIGVVNYIFEQRIKEWIRLFFLLFFKIDEASQFLRSCESRKLSADGTNLNKLLHGRLKVWSTNIKF